MIPPPPPRESAALGTVAKLPSRCWGPRGLNELDRAPPKLPRGADCRRGTGAGRLAAGRLAGPERRVADPPPGGADLAALARDAAARDADPPPPLEPLCAQQAVGSSQIPIPKMIQMCRFIIVFLSIIKPYFT